MKYLFWNTKKKGNEINELIAELIEETKAEIIGLAEYEGDVKNILKILETKGINLYYLAPIGCKRIKIISKYPPHKIEHGPETNYYTIKKFPHDKLGIQLIAFVHLPSKLHKDSADRQMELRYLKIDMEKYGIDNIVILGDFNANPFEKELMAADSLHALSDRREVGKKTRIVQQREHKIYYNPMWNLFGDEKGVPGTYYYYAATTVNYFWNIYDQVIISSNLIKNFNVDQLNIIKSINNKSLLNDKGIPDTNISDHLPLVFEIK